MRLWIHIWPPAFLNLITTLFNIPFPSSRSIPIPPPPEGPCLSLRLILTSLLWAPNTFIMSQSYFSQMIHMLLCFGCCSMISKRRWLLSVALICQPPRQQLAGSHELGRSFQTSWCGGSYLLFLSFILSSPSFPSPAQNINSSIFFFASGQGYCIENSMPCIAPSFVFPWTMVSHTLTIADGWFRG